MEYSAHTEKVFRVDIGGKAKLTLTSDQTQGFTTPGNGHNAFV